VREIHALATGPSGGHNGGRGTRLNAHGAPHAGEAATWITSLDIFRLTGEDLQIGVGSFGLANENVIFGGNRASQCGGSS